MQVAVAVNDNMGAKKKYISDNKTVLINQLIRVLQIKTNNFNHGVLLLLLLLFA